MDQRLASYSPEVTLDYYSNHRYDFEHIPEKEWWDLMKESQQHKNITLLTLLLCYCDIHTAMEWLTNLWLPINEQQDIRFLIAVRTVYPTYFASEPFYALVLPSVSIEGYLYIQQHNPSVSEVPTEIFEDNQRLVKYLAGATKLIKPLAYSKLKDTHNEFLAVDQFFLYYNLNNKKRGVGLITNIRDNTIEYTDYPSTYESWGMPLRVAIETRPDLLESYSYTLNGDKKVNIKGLKVTDKAVADAYE